MAPFQPPLPSERIVYRQRETSPVRDPASSSRLTVIERAREGLAALGEEPKRARFQVDDSSSETSDSDTMDVNSPRRFITRRISRRGSVTETDGSTMYSFTPSRVSRAPSSAHSVGDEEEEMRSSERSSAQQGNGGQQVLATYVFESRYSGESRLGEPHTIKLSMQKSTSGKKKNLFRWM